jgi:hypothetical protein
MMPLITIDFEASCLPIHGRSFPVEVGIADLSGWSRSWLILPHADWRDWCWMPEAEALHGITRDRLGREGRPAQEVMAELNAATQGYRVIADHDLDQQWLATLSHSAGVPATFRIGHIAELLDRYQPTPEALRRAVAIADGQAPMRHQARADAIWLASVANSVAGGPCPPSATKAAA